MKEINLTILVELMLWEKKTDSAQWVKCPWQPAGKVHRAGR
jgi:hypothetical protein